MTKQSAGILMFKRVEGELLVLLVHPGGPFWRNKDEGAWSIPKGEFGPGEAPEAAARREFEEELGSPPTGPLRALGSVRQRGGKVVEGFALESDLDSETIRPGTFTLEWPPRSGRMQAFPEVDRAAWFSLDRARGKILSGQAPLLDRLLTLLEAEPD